MISSFTSYKIVLNPAVAETCAMPLPIVPAPQMQIVVIKIDVKIVAFKRFNFHKEKLFMQVSSKPSPKIRSGSVAFLIAILLFLMPFVNIKCNDQKFASNTGIGLAFGINYKTTSQLKSDKNKGDRNLSISEKQSGKMY